jgi:phage-related protein
VFAAGKRIVALHGIRHKAQTVSKNDLETARARKADWLARNHDAKNKL